MSDIAIKVENLSKKYRIGKTRSGSLRDTLAMQLGAIFSGHAKDEEFWALKDVSFEVKQGEVLGVIGRNGAGKSTLLKILSRITEPTTGRVELNGRVASLLEVGTGFHPELTGRENIFLNGALLGMTRKEIKSKFDEVVDFSGVEQFIDTPVKKYSSGMYVRLAFAVAAHLESEILLVDEVLAVGDFFYQQKCLDHLNSAKKKGKTVLLVSHEIANILKICNKSILFNQGILSYFGESTIAIEKLALQKNTDTSCKECFYLSKIVYKNSEPNRFAFFEFNSQISMKIKIHVHKRIKNTFLALILHNNNQYKIFKIEEKLDNYTIIENYITLKIDLPSKLLLPGKYYWQCIFHIPNEKVLSDKTNFGPFTIYADNFLVHKFAYEKEIIFPQYKILE